MIYTCNDKLPVKENNYQYYFLAGSIDYQSKTPWRKTIIEKSSKRIHFFDPTNKNHHNLSDTEMKNQIEWELNTLELSDKIILNFLGYSKSPISLVEMGLYAQSGKLIIICPPEFYQNRYMYPLASKYNIPLFKNLCEFLDSFQLY
ncbi:nucleoside 2-deoxyribosyltransferase domain-containing protein [Tenacibaculum sp. 190524A02b]|uniref:nucleoside 2-deoxyribosyltransferase domain-containing protein n=1 Tax=Tenacibaculum vairaonense TaxID=3137860 RepID=UPI0031FAB440